MKIFTSYYANIKNIPDDYILVSVSGGITKEIEDAISFRDTRFTPKKDFFLEYKNSPEGKEREDIYVQNFKEKVLDELNLNEILINWSDEHGVDKNIVLLCYEKPSDFCHRHIIAEEIYTQFDIEIEEIGMEDYERKDYKYIQKQTLDESEW